MSILYAFFMWLAHCIPVYHGEKHIKLVEMVKKSVKTLRFARHYI